MLPSCDFSFSVNENSSRDGKNHQPCFHSFCKEELPPLSPITIKSLPASNRASTPKKNPFLLNEIFSDQILDFETIERKNHSGKKNPNLFEQLFCDHSNEFSVTSPYFKRKNVLGSFKSASVYESFAGRHLEINEMAVGKVPLNPVLSSFTFPGFEGTKKAEKLATLLSERGDQKGEFKEPSAKENHKKVMENEVKTPQKDKSHENSTVSTEIKVSSPDEKPKKSRSSEKKSPKLKKVTSGLLTGANENGGCKCKKSKCLKLYCECFSNGKLCKDGCSCNNCSNKTAEDNHEREIAIHGLISKNPNIPNLTNLLNLCPDAPKLKKTNSGNPAEKFKKGCNCKKSQCLKKYCECYEAGLKCEEYCKCDDCKNMADGKKKPNPEGEADRKKTPSLKENLGERDPALKKKRRLE